MNDYRSEGSFSAMLRGAGSPNFSSIFASSPPAEQAIVFGRGSAGTTPRLPAVSNSGGRLGGEGRSWESTQLFMDNSPGEDTVVFGSASARNAATGANRGGRERTRSPSPNLNSMTVGSLSAGQQAPGKVLSQSPEQLSEEEAAKARRLVRFSSGFEMRPDAVKSASMIDDNEISTGNTSALWTPEPASKSFPGVQRKSRELSPAGRSEMAGEPSLDMDAPENSSLEPILGICPDMCPEVERNERERKGDLDRFERVGGNRNQTSRELAVKKYTRTAEKDPVLIRPLSVLTNTMDHLLSLLDRNHDDDLLAVHSFLWDRMRAVRMDLRMQHIFTEDAIAMHEQMIRFHILAMHELCEYSQGEGISEVFNPHLNIEQMNKASVDLFEMYEDHAKRGTPVAAEAEFRGYYALLKLDKHPGYRVEPAELSLDLAKMTPEIRNSKQVRFARDVARACRAGNYVAFFRLAKEASYLQACLMHAHFSKLRTQALGSLHSGLQKNQGIPLPTVINWLGMEGEDVEALVRYHGFSLKYYEEPYMVKEGPFLNKSQDFPTCRAQLVESKQSLTVVLDVLRGWQPVTKSPVKRTVRRGSFGIRVNDISPDSEDQPRAGLIPMGSVVNTKEADMNDYDDEPLRTELEDIEEISEPALGEAVKVLVDEDEKKGKKRRMEERQFEAEEHEKRRLRHEVDAAARRAASQAASQAAALELKRLEDQQRRAGYQAEALAGKQRCCFRRWRRRVASKVLERRKKLQQTQAALHALSIGYPLSNLRVQGESLSSSERRDNVGALVEEQGVLRQHLWEPLDIPRLIGPILKERNPQATFLFWKLLLSTPSSSVGKWVQTKIGTKRSLPGRDTDQMQPNFKLAEENVLLNGNQDSAVVDFWYCANELGCTGDGLKSRGALQGAGGLIFLMDENESFFADRIRLHSLVQALPDGVCLPLLVLSPKWISEKRSEVMGDRELPNWEQVLKLGELSKIKVSTSKIISIMEGSGSNSGEKGYPSNKALKEGLVWLAESCPVQPILRSLSIADLVREHLDELMKPLGRMPSHKVVPDHFIIWFNQALQSAAAEIGDATWSSSGLKTSEDKRQEHLLSRLLGNSTEAVETLLADLKSSLLPQFPPLPLSNSESSIVSQKLKLEETLLQFFTQIEGSTLDRVAMKWNVSRMVQKGCDVKWSESGRQLVPNWARIFSAVLSSQLLVLSQKPRSLVYVAQIARGRYLQHFRAENGSDRDHFLTVQTSSPDGQFLLDQVVSEDPETKLLMERNCSPESPRSRLEFSTPGSNDNSQDIGNAIHEWNSFPPDSDIFLSDWRGQHSRHIASFGNEDWDSHSRQDRSLYLIHRRDEQIGLTRGRLALTHSERMLDKMVADMKHAGHDSKENAQARQVDHGFAPHNVSAVEDHVNQETALGDGFISPEQVSTALQRVKKLKVNEVLLLSPFEVLMDEMVAEFSKRSSKEYSVNYLFKERVPL